MNRIPETAPKWAIPALKRVEATISLRVGLDGWKWEEATRQHSFWYRRAGRPRRSLLVSLCESDRSVTYCAGVDGSFNRGGEFASAYAHLMGDDAPGLLLVEAFNQWREKVFQKLITKGVPRSRVFASLEDIKKKKEWAKKPLAEKRRIIGDRRQSERKTSKQMAIKGVL